MSTSSLIQAVAATVAALIGAGLLVWSLRRSAGVVRPRPMSTQPPAPVPSAGPELHTSWTEVESNPPVAGEPDQSVARRAAVLSGLQLVLAAALLVGGLYLASTVTADQLLHLGR